MRGCCKCGIVVIEHQPRCARRRTHQGKRLWFYQRTGNSNPQRQHKPDQHPTGEELCLSKRLQISHGSKLSHSLDLHRHKIVPMRDGHKVRGFISQNRFKKHVAACIGLIQVIDRYANWGNNNCQMAFFRY